MKFNVTVAVNATLYLTVEAKDEEEALAIAEDFGEPGICHCCSSQNGRQDGPILECQFAIDCIENPELSEDE